MPWQLSAERGPAQADVRAQRGPSCGLFRATLPESCARLRPDFRIAERLPAALERAFGELGARRLRAHPCLGVGKQASHLLEQHASRRPGLLERLDPPEPRQYGTRLVHVPTVARRAAPLCDEFVPSLTGQGADAE